MLSGSIQVSRSTWIPLFIHSFTTCLDPWLLARSHTSGVWQRPAWWGSATHLGCCPGPGPQGWASASQCPHHPCCCQGAIVIPSIRKSPVRYSMLCNTTLPRYGDTPSSYITFQENKCRAEGTVVVWKQIVYGINKRNTYVQLIQGSNPLMTPPDTANKAESQGPGSRARRLIVITLPLIDKKWWYNN